MSLCPLILQKRILPTKANLSVAWAAGGTSARTGNPAALSPQSSSLQLPRHQPD